MSRPSSVFPRNISPACLSHTNTTKSRSTSATVSSSWTTIRMSSMSSSPIPLTQKDQQRACSRSHTLSYSLELSRKAALLPHKVVRSPLSFAALGVFFRRVPSRKCSRITPFSFSKSAPLLPCTFSPGIVKNYLKISNFSSAVARFAFALNFYIC